MAKDKRPDHRTASSYFDLTRELAITDFKLKYQGSVLGYVWSFAKPMMLFAVLYVVFTRFIPLGKGVAHYPLYLLLGIVLWTYFADSTATAMGSIVDRGDLIRKVYFPRIVILIAASLSSVITLVLNLLVIMVFLLIARLPFHINGLWFFALIAEMYVLSLGCALFLSAAYVKFRDFRHIWEVALQILFYGSAIIYPLASGSSLGISKRIVPYILINPIAQIVQDARHLLITNTAYTAHDKLHGAIMFVPYVLPVIVLVIGYAVFMKAAPKFAEEI